MVLWLRHKHTKISGYVTDCDRDNIHSGKSRVYQQHQTEESCTLAKVIFLILSQMQHLCLNAYTALNHFRGLYIVMV